MKSIPLIIVGISEWVGGDLGNGLSPFLFFFGKQRKIGLKYSESDS